MSTNGEDPAFARGYAWVGVDDAMTAEDPMFPATQDCRCHGYQNGSTEIVASASQGCGYKKTSE